jgi:hypothetical protein
MAETKTPMQKQREQRRAQGWRDVNIWLTPEGQQRVARLMEPGESLSTLIERALAALDAVHKAGGLPSRSSDRTSDPPEDLQFLIAREVSRYFTSESFRDHLFLPLLKQSLANNLPSDVTRDLTREAITGPALPVHGPTVQSQASASDDQRPAVLTRLRAMQAEGLSLQKIADRLNADGVPTLSGKGRWQKGTISNLLAEAEGRETR